MYKYKLMPSAIEDLPGDRGLYSGTVECAGERDPSAGKSGGRDPFGRAFLLSLPPVNDELLRMKGYRKILVNNYIVFVFARSEERSVKCHACVVPRPRLLQRALMDSLRRL